MHAFSFGFRRPALLLVGLAALNVLVQALLGSFCGQKENRMTSCVYANF
jgi:hypothetical protein